jgi:hypothetical protein
MLRFILIWAGLTVAGLANAGLAAGAEEPPSQPEASPKEWLAERQAEFEAYEFSLGAEEPRKLTLESRSLLNWSNAERGADVGAVFLWTDKGRPQLIACAFGRGELLRHEFHSLSTEPMAAERGADSVHRFGPGIAWQELPAAPAASKQRALRLTQMRRQAQRFRVVMGGKQPSEMRLLTQPVYRTPAELEADVAIFAFVQGTDPECVLLLEATAEGKWRYAVTRQTNWPLEVELDGNQIADFPSISRTPPESPFFVLKPPGAAR